MFDKLTKVHERESRAVTALARSLRLTHQSRYDEKTANTAAKNAPVIKPWKLTLGMSLPSRHTAAA